MYTTTACPEAYRSTLEYLDRLAEQWRKTGQCPTAAGVLSSDEYRALAMAAGRERELHGPIRDFLLMDRLLQRWVLESWERPGLIGMRIG